MTTETTASNYARFRVTDKEFEISGPVDFVKEQLNGNKDVLRSFLELSLSRKENLPLPASLTPSSLQLEQTPADYADFVEINSMPAALDRFNSVVAIDKDKIQILSKIPGNALTQRMINLILVHLFIRLKQNVERVSSNELRDACEMHGEFDAKHFSEYIKKNKRYFLIEGDGKKFTAKLTIPAMQEAERLLETMSNNK